MEEWWKWWECGAWCWGRGGGNADGGGGVVVVVVVVVSGDGGDFLQPESISFIYLSAQSNFLRSC
jgi:hypothetical protein